MIRDRNYHDVYSNMLNESKEDVLKAMKGAEVFTAYFVADPSKKHQSALDDTIYVNRKDAEKAAKKLGAEVESWLGLYRGGVTKYKIPKKYKLVK